jgi:hypothetical protein
MTSVVSQPTGIAANTGLQRFYTLWAGSCRLNVLVPSDIIERQHSM